MEDQETSIISLTADIVSAHVGNNNVSVNDVPTLVRNVYEALTSLSGAGQAEAPEAPPTPAVSVRSSVKPDHLVCLECGAKQKTLKRHLQNAHSLTPAEYRQRFGLKADYPMVAPEYSKQRSAMAQSIGLGRGGRKKVEEASKPKRPGRKPKAAAVEAAPTEE